MWSAAALLPLFFDFALNPTRGKSLVRIAHVAPPAPDALLQTRRSNHATRNIAAKKRRAPVARGSFASSNFRSRGN